MVVAYGYFGKVEVYHFRIAVSQHSEVQTGTELYQSNYSFREQKLLPAYLLISLDHLVLGSNRLLAQSRSIDHATKNCRLGLHFRLTLPSRRY
jgi:hypothetical protein